MNELEAIVEYVEAVTPTMPVTVLDFMTKDELASEMFRRGYDEGFADGFQEGIEDL